MWNRLPSYPGTHHSVRHHFPSRQNVFIFRRYFTGFWIQNSYKLPVNPEPTLSAPIASLSFVQSEDDLSAYCCLGLCFPAHKLCLCCTKCLPQCLSVLLWMRGAAALREGACGRQWLCPGGGAGAGTRLPSGTEPVPPTDSSQPRKEESVRGCQWQWRTVPS